MSASLAEAIFWSALVLCCVAQAALLHSFFRGAARVRAGAPAGFRATETLWAVLPALVLAGLLVASRQAMQAPVTIEWTPGQPLPAAPAPEARP
jgi:hypothetical protein